jgi:hypothetical protein
MSKAPMGLPPSKGQRLVNLAVVPKTKLNHVEESRVATLKIN